MRRIRYVSELAEGPDEAVDALYRRILADRRHRNVMVLGDERGDLKRQCPDWAMKKVDLSMDAAVRSEPLKAILEASAAQFRILKQLVSALERAMWRQLIDAELEELDRFAGKQTGPVAAPPQP